MEFRRKWREDIGEGEGGRGRGRGRGRSVRVTKECLGSGPRTLGVVLDAQDGFVSNGFSNGWFASRIEDM